MSTRLEEIRERQYGILHDYTTAEQDVRYLLRLVEAQEKAIRIAGDPQCHGVHHAKGDQHAYDESCPVIERYRKLRSEALQALDEVNK